MKLKIHTDGGARGNPGPAASAFVVLNENGEVIYQKGEYVGETTNNQAEYMGVLLALNWLRDSDYNNTEGDLTFVLDSELVVRQLIGQYKVKEENLKHRKGEIDLLLNELKIKHINFINVPRSQNSVADSLVNQTLDAR